MSEAGIKSGLTFVVLMLAAQAVWAAPELKGNPQELRSFLKDPVNEVRISGSNEEVAYADIAKITIFITTENKLLSEAVASNSAIRERITREFIAAGVAQDKVNTSKFSSSPQFGWFGDKPKSYNVVNRMEVEVSAEAHMKAVTAATDVNPEVTLGEMEFEYSGEDAIEKRVLAAAIDDVMAQKAYYEQQLGLVLSPVSFTAPNVYAAPRERYMASSFDEITVTARKANSTEEDFYMTFDEIDYGAAVVVTFEVTRPE